MLPGNQLLEPTFPHRERFERLTPIRRIKGFLQRFARAEPGEQLQRIEHIAFPGSIRSKQHGKRLDMRLDIEKRFVAFDVNTLEHGIPVLPVSHCRILHAIRQI